MTGTFLLLLLFTGVAVTGRIINRMAAEMSGRIVTQIGEYHFHLLQIEFTKGGEALDVAAEYMSDYPACTDAELQVLASTLTAIHPKLERMWFLTPGNVVKSFLRHAGTPAATPVSPQTDRSASLQDERKRAQTVRSNTLPAGRDKSLQAAPSKTQPTYRNKPQQSVAGTAFYPSEAAAALRKDTLWSGVVVRADSVHIWCMARRFTDRNGGEHLCGAELPLLDIHSYLTEQNPYSRSYATVLTTDGTIVYHPERELIGTRTADTAALRMLRRVATTGREQLSGTVSEYLGVEEERIYYPLDVPGGRWIACIGIPRLTIEQQISDFHFFTVLTAVISILFFAVLLVLAQRRWRREYQLRQESERESEKLHLQQVLEQIDPHFLFNSLNSLYALIRTDAEQARAFTLTLSRVYRHLLERRNEILAALDDEIDFTWQYYSLQKIRFGERIVLTVAVDPALRKSRIPSMSLQTLVENAVKHNRITASTPLCIRIYTDGQGLVIENNFTPRPGGNTDSLGMGLERIRAVYRFYTEENISVETTDEMFRCRLPLLPAETSDD